MSTQFTRNDYSDKENRNLNTNLAMLGQDMAHPEGSYTASNQSLVQSHVTDDAIDNYMGLSIGVSPIDIHKYITYAHATSDCKKKIKYAKVGAIVIRSSKQGFEVLEVYDSRVKSDSKKWRLPCMGGKYEPSKCIIKEYYKLIRACLGLSSSDVKVNPSFITYEKESLKEAICFVIGYINKDIRWPKSSFVKTHRWIPINNMDEGYVSNSVKEIKKYLLDEEFNEIV